jgi:alginate O-acetyltransferase complex protein AlgI
MLFNSHIFIFAFLPLVLLGYYALTRAAGARAGIVFLVLASIFFYGWWNPIYVPLLVGLMLGNFALGSWLGALQERPRAAKALLTVGITVNLAVLCYYKYTNFLIDNLRQLTGWEVPIASVVLPLGISFFIFQKIAYLVDSYRGETRGYGVVDYCLFVSFFPQLIAGPIVHHKDVVPQFRASDGRLRADDLVAGITLFSIGLFKKVVLADNISVFANQAFNFIHSGQDAGFFTAWGGALAYTLQLYFDFSGYCDMAIGLARLFGIKLPMNFDSPYQAHSIIEFWRRWHITLSRFLRDYLYIGLGGNRKGPVRRHVNLMLTMLLGGLWHGAGWTFVFWGFLHGAYLIINHAWRHATADVRWLKTPIFAAASWAVTLLAVVVGWVFFRAASFGDAASMLAGMCGLNGIAVPDKVLPHIPALAQLGLGVEDMGMKFIGFAWIIALGLIALFAPNSQQIMHRVEPVLEQVRPTRGPTWSPSLRWATVTGILFTASLLSLSRVSEFLYFQF